MKLTISERLMHSTVRIEVINKEGIILSTGTGFSFRYIFDEDKYVPILVTNKHVVKGAKIGRLVFTVADSQNNPDYGEKFSYVIYDFEKAFTFHPDINVDLCIMFMQPIYEDAIAKYNKSLFTMSLDESLIPTSEQIETLSVLKMLLW